MRLGVLHISLALAFATACHQPRYILEQSSQHYTVGKEGKADSSFTSFLQPYKQRMDSAMQVVIGYTDTILTKAQPESALGNFVADAMLHAARQVIARTDAAVCNQGGLRIPSIQAGNITVGKLYELMPFDNTLTIVEINGKVLIQWCHHMAAAKGWPVSGIRFAIKDGKAINMQINGKPIDENASYTIATNDYLATGGDKCSFLIPLKAKPCNLFIRDVLIDYVKALQKANKPLHPYIEKRVRYAE
jgi:2',3'-cyclic-nucleotide 2'-phosphodiesterase (5'-nucleotidase family)